MTFSLRPGQPNDAPAIATILSDWIDETDWMVRIHTREEDQGFGKFLLDKTDVTIALRGDRVGGFLARQHEDVQALYLAPFARGQGGGQALLDAAKAMAPRLSLWCFQANEGARAFYAREGFQEVELTDGQGNDEKLPDVRLVWKRET